MNSPKKPSFTRWKMRASDSIVRSPPTLAGSLNPVEHDAEAPMGGPTNETATEAAPTMFYGSIEETPQKPTVSTSLYDRVSNETLESLCEYLERVGDAIDVPGYDCEYANGVLTIKIGAKGTYVINRQPPNRQIWLSSPLSGPKRYDLDMKTGQWVYEREGDIKYKTLNELLNFELSSLLDLSVKTPTPRLPDRLD